MEANISLSLKIDLWNEHLIGSSNQKINAAITEDNILITIESLDGKEFFIHNIERYSGSGSLSIFDTKEVYSIDKKKVGIELVKVNIMYPLDGSNKKLLFGDRPIEQRKRRNLVIAQINTINQQQLKPKFIHPYNCKKSKEKKF